MKFLGWIFTVFALLAHLAVGLFLFGVGLVGLSGSEEMHFPLVPGVSPESMPATLALLGLFALLAVLLALRSGKLSRLLLLLWSLLVPALLICAFFRPTYRFDGEDHFRLGVYVFIGSLLALWGALSHFRRATSVERL
jgi:hypothetical protein